MSSPTSSAKDQKTKPHHNGITTAPAPEQDAREWFDKLSTGEERATAMAITDKGFIERYINLLYCQQLQEASEAPKGSSMVTETVSLNDIATMFDDKLLVPRTDSVSEGSTSHQPLAGQDSSKLSRIPTVPDEHCPSQESGNGKEQDSSESNHKNEVDGEVCATDVPAEGFESTAFRIRSENTSHQGPSSKESASRSNGDTKVVGEKSKSDSFVTTLHFKSGLSMPISGSSDADRNNMIAIMGKRDAQSQTTATPSYNVQKQKESNEVDKRLTFSALQNHFTLTQQPTPTKSPISTKSPTKPIDTSDSRKKKSQAISGSKASAARAMSRQLGLESEFLSHVRLVFSAALQSEHLPNKAGHHNNNGVVEFAIIDPKYLNQRMGSSLRFLNDAQNLLDKRKSSLYGNDCKADNSFIFLANNNSKVSNNDAVDEQWFDGVLHSMDDSPKDLLLLLLAKVEMCIRASHERYIQESTNGIEKRDVDKAEVGMEDNEIGGIQGIISALSDDLSSSEIFSTPPELEEELDNRDSSATMTNSVTDRDVKNDMGSTLINTCDLFSKVGKSASLPQSTHLDISPPKAPGHDILEDLIQQILYIWTRLNSVKESLGRDKLIDETRLLFRRFLCDSELHNNTASFFQLQDLILVPLSCLSFMSGNPKKAGDMEERNNYVDDLLKKWNNVVSSGLHLVNKTLGSIGSESLSCHEKDETKLDLLDQVEDDLFFLAEPPKQSAKSKKKKKKKKKRKQSASSSTSNNNTTNGGLTAAKVVENEQPGPTPMSTIDSKNVSNEKANDHCKSTSESVAETGDCAASTVTASSDKKKDSQVIATVAPILSTDITVSRLNGVCVIGGARVQEEEDNEDDDAWETVEHKGGRGNKKNTVNSRPAGDKKEPEQQGVSSPSSAKRNKKSKNRRNNTRRKVKDVKEYLNSVYESVGEKVSENAGDIQPESDECNPMLPSNRQTNHENKTGIGAELQQNSRAASLRDVVVGNLSTYKPLKLKAPSLPNPVISRKKPTLSTSLKKKEGGATLCTKSGKKAADQSTAPTLPETLSGISAATQSSSNTDVAEQVTSTKETKVANEKCDEVNDAAKATTELDRIRDEFSTSTDGGEEPASRCTTSFSKSSAPPVQTLIGGNTNSTTSSVASSLEAPHATRHRGRRHSPGCKEDDVGYHLLKVCERLSADIDTFMARRASALDIRRRERSALLSALQDTVQSIWDGDVKTYGSCATKLDLPSSDLDVVICGLDSKMEEDTQNLPPQLQSTSSPSARSRSCSNVSNDSNSSFLSHNHFYQPLSINGNRILRLSSELELQPWAVQVKAIPTATVPVIKILADPLRLPGAVGTIDWMLHQQQLAAEMNSAHVMSMEQQPESNDQNSCGIVQNTSSKHSDDLSTRQAQYRSSTPPWRGADVMNGLLPLDITFEGPEHGGLGSTDFSNRVVEDACNEAGLAPEKTPAVQVVMVLKELLAQRRLNEPFSGGLSSYAILLLVVAVIKERRLIREELERVERQQRAVTSESSASPSFEKDAHAISKDSFAKVCDETKSSSNNATSKTCDKGEESNSQPLKQKAPTRVNSWAAIAKKSTVQSKNSEEDSKGKPALQSSESSATESLATSHMENVSKTCGEKGKEKPSKQIDEGTPMSSKPCAFPQGSNDVLEVLCSGEPTAGKLFMHFLLFYGRHFDPQTTSIDVRGTHHPEYKGEDDTRSKSLPDMIHHLSPFVPRKPGGSYNPITEVYTVDPVVVYDPLMGAESNNVARSCFAWGTIRWVFEQCFNTLSGVVERGPRSNNEASRRRQGRQAEPSSTQSSSEKLSDLNTDIDELSPLLELLLSF